MICQLLLEDGQGSSPLDGGGGGGGGGGGTWLYCLDHHLARSPLYSLHLWDSEPSMHGAWSKSRFKFCLFVTY